MTCLFAWLLACAAPPDVAMAPGLAAAEHDRGGDRGGCGPAAHLRFACTTEEGPLSLCDGGTHWSARGVFEHPRIVWAGDHRPARWDGRVRHVELRADTTAGLTLLLHDDPTTSPPAVVTSYVASRTRPIACTSVDVQDLDPLPPSSAWPPQLLPSVWSVGSWQRGSLSLQVDARWHDGAHVAYVGVHERHHDGSGRMRWQGVGPRPHEPAVEAEHAGCTVRVEQTNLDVLTVSTRGDCPSGVAGDYARSLWGGY